MGSLSASGLARDEAAGGEGQPDVDLRHPAKAVVMRRTLSHSSLSARTSPSFASVVAAGRSWPIFRHIDSDNSAYQSEEGDDPELDVQRGSTTGGIMYTKNGLKSEGIGSMAEERQDWLALSANPTGSLASASSDLLDETRAQGLRRISESRPLGHTRSLRSSHES